METNLNVTVINKNNNLQAELDKKINNLQSSLSSNKKKILIQAQINDNSHAIQSSLSSLNQAFSIDMASSIIYAISPTAKVEKLPNGNVLITITDKNGTTVSEIDNVSYETINNFIQKYLQENQVVEEYFEEHGEELKNYEKLNNIPSIEGVPLIGDKTFAQLQMQKLTNTDIESLLQ